MLAALFFALWFGTLETRGLFWPDEGRYAEIAREMAASGDYVTPRLNGLKYFEKPPLQYWASAIGFRLFEPDEWSARLWPATTGFALVVVSAALWWRWRGPAAGLIAGSVLASAWGIVSGAQILTLDMGLACFLSLALLAFIGAHRPGLDARARSRAMALVWAAMALAVLAKGLIGVVLPGLALVVYAAIERDASILKGAFPLRGIALFLAITVPWFVLVQHANPEFFDLFFVQEHFRRYLEPGHHRPGPWWYFLPVAAAGLLPWTGTLPGALRDAWRAPRQGTLSVERLLLIWSVVVVVFFSASRSKLPAYILPALPALAWLIALSPAARHPRIASERRDRKRDRRRRNGRARDAARRNRETARHRRRPRRLPAVPRDGRRRAAGWRRARGRAATSHGGDDTYRMARAWRTSRPCRSCSPGRTCSMRTTRPNRRSTRSSAKGSRFRVSPRSTASGCWTRAFPSTSGVR